MLTVILPSEEIARPIADELGTKVVADAGWHVYSNMEQILEQRTITPEKCPFTCSPYTSRGGEMRYWKGMLPRTDALLARSLNISIGVSDPGLELGLRRDDARRPRRRRGTRQALPRSRRQVSGLAARGQTVRERFVVNRAASGNSYYL